MTRARAGGTGEEKFGYYERAHVKKDGSDWVGFRPYFLLGEVRSTWAGALSYALGEDET